MNIELKLSQIRSYFCDLKIGSESGSGTESLSKVTSTQQKSVAMNLNLQSGNKGLNNFSKTKGTKPKIDNLKKHLHLLGFLILAAVFLGINTNLHAETIVMKADRWCPFICDPTGRTTGDDLFILPSPKNPRSK